jgi:hypothetical protein
LCHVLEVYIPCWLRDLGEIGVWEGLDKSFAQVGRAILPRRENRIRPQINCKRKIEALERRRALIDALIEFIRTHPLSVEGAHLHPLANRTGLRYDYAV